MKQVKEKEYYEEIKDWDFSKFEIETEHLTNWDFFGTLSKLANQDSKILDLGTGGGEKVLERFPECAEILETDFSEGMIETAKKNLEKSGRKNITFRLMDNLAMDVPDNYFDIVVARNTVTDPIQIYKCLKPGGYLLIHGVDKADCWNMKVLFGKGQAYKDINPISLIDYENILDAGFKDVELIPIHIREYYKTKEDLLALLLKTPILYDFSETQNNKQLKIGQTDLEVLDRYIERNKKDKGILLIRSYYGITARK